MTSNLDRPDNRLHFLDNLRSFLIFLVVLLHAGLVYESSGAVAFFWIVDDLIPLYKAIFLSSRGLSQESWTTYFHMTNGIYSQNWLWFLPVLFLVSAAYVLLDRLGWVPTKLSLGLALTAACAIGFVNSLGMERLGFRGWTKTWLIDFQNERLLVYFLSFMIGVLCFHHQVFAARSPGERLYITAAATAWLPINIYLLFLLAPFIKPGTVLISPLLDRVVVWTSFYASLLGMAYLSIQTFRRHLDRSGRIWRELGRNSYPVYIIHVIVIGVLATVLLSSAMPSLLKYLVLTTGSYLLSNLAVSVYRRLKAGARPEALVPEPARTT